MIPRVFLILISLNYYKTMRTRGNRYKLTQHHCHYVLRKYTYTNRVIPIWNSLSDYVVSAETVNTFKRAILAQFGPSACPPIRLPSLPSLAVPARPSL